MTTTTNRSACPDCGSDWSNHRYGCIWATPTKEPKADPPAYERVKVNIHNPLDPPKPARNLLNFPEHDPVERPKHYTQGGIECIDAIDAAIGQLTGSEAFCTGNAIKYLWRWKTKGGKEDLRKARWYIDRMLRETPTKV